jgi:hypothetical protein
LGIAVRNLLAQPVGEFLDVVLAVVALADPE